ncbi:OmpW family protein [Sphaerotilus sp.]|uniref:OmpW/AlkL family protein n=1 Tax=Sphaerotilus sp. TaxID=2093942 RepID=UPI0034E2D902
MTLRLNPVLWATAALLLTGTAHAQSAGTLTGRLSVTRIAPDVTSGNLTSPSFAGTQADITANTQPTGGLTWMVDDHVAIDLPLALGFRHDLVGAGAIAGVGKIGEVQALPISLLAQYRFMEPSAQIRPYVGAGPTYARFYKARSTAVLSGLTGGSPANPTTLTVDSRLGLTMQLGASIAVAPRWSLDVSVLKTLLKTTAHLSSGQTLDVTVNPTSYTVGLGYQF